MERNYTLIKIFKSIFSQSMYICIHMPIFMRTNSSSPVTVNREIVHVARGI